MNERLHRRIIPRYSCQLHWSSEDRFSVYLSKIMYKYFIYVFLVTILFNAGNIWAADPAASNWKGEAELGYVQTSGNSQTTTVSTKFGIKHEKDAWRQKLSIAALRASDSGETTAEQFSSLLRAEYILTSIDYLFGSVRYEDDRFAGYDQRTTEVLGYGHTVINTASHKLSLETGAGARQTENVDGSSNDEGLIRLALDYEWKISDHSLFRENLTVDKGQDNTVTESVTELKLKINSALSMKVTVTVKDNSEVPVGTKNTDTSSAVTLVYDF